MAIIRVGSVLANGDTVDISGIGIQPYDLIIPIAYRNDSQTEPTSPVDSFVQLKSSGSANGIWAYYKYATSVSESFGTFVNATQVACLVYRSNSGKLLKTVGENRAGTTSTAISYPLIDNHSLHWQEAWVIGAAGTIVNSSNAEGAPSGMTNIGSIAGAGAGELTVHDTNGSIATWPSTSFTASSSVVYRSLVLGIQETEFLIPSGGGGLAKLIGNNSLLS